MTQPAPPAPAPGGRNVTLTRLRRERRQAWFSVALVVAAATRATDAEWRLHWVLAGGLWASLLVFGVAAVAAERSFRARRELERIWSVG